MQELHSEIISHDKQERAGHIVVAPEGMTVEDNDILEPEPIRKGGLQRSGVVRSLFRVLFNWIVSHLRSTPTSAIHSVRPQGRWNLPLPDSPSSDWTDWRWRSAELMLRNLAGKSKDWMEVTRLIPKDCLKVGT